jgi:hypothetical protein
MIAIATPCPELSRPVKFFARSVFGAARARPTRWVTRVEGAPVEEVGVTTVATGRSSTRVG